LGSH